MNSSQQQPVPEHVPYSARTVDYFVDQLDNGIRDSLTPEQLDGIRAVIKSAMPQPAPKLVDLRVNVDLLVARFYVVLFVGKERRKQPRTHKAYGLAAIFNKFAAAILLVGLNLSISLFIFLMAYLLKSALGINLFSGHLRDYLN